MTFSKHLFFVLSLVVAAVTSHQLNAMEDAMTAMLEKHVASDFQIYQLLSAAAQGNPELYLPAEVIHIIASDVCYQKYGGCLRSPDNLLKLVKDSLNKSVSHMTIVHILKTCLSYSGKSLSEIRDSSRYTVLHQLNFFYHGYYHESIQDNVKIVCLVAGDQAWNLITERDDNGNTALHYLWDPSINQLLSTAPNPGQAWALINSLNDRGETPLRLVKLNGKIEFIEILESYRPK